MARHKTTKELRRAAIIAIYFSLLSNGLLSIYFLFINPQFFTGDVFSCFVVAILGALASLVGIFPFSVDSIGRRRLLASLILHAGFLITMFAGIYRGFGISDGKAVVSPDPGTAFYFSAVTWTTLGYGDFKPSDELQLVAAGQAGLGYLFLGLIVAILAVEVMDHHP